MEVALITKEKEYFEEIFSSHKTWQVDFINNAIDAFNKKYDLIVLDYPIEDDTIVNSLINKENTEIAIISDKIEEHVNEAVVNNENIGAIIDRSDLQDFIEWLQYFDSKTMINKNITLEMNANIIYNGYSYKICKEIAIIHINENVLTGESRMKLVKDLQQTNYNCIFNFTDSTAVITSLLLGQIIYFYNIIKQQDGNMVLVIPDKERKDLFTGCSLDKIIKIFDDVSSAKQYIEEKIGSFSC